jgi:hypothetical protein
MRELRIENKMGPMGVIFKRCGYPDRSVNRMRSTLFS